MNITLEHKKSTWGGSSSSESPIDFNLAEMGELPPKTTAKLAFVIPWYSRNFMLLEGLKDCISKGFPEARIILLEDSNDPKISFEEELAGVEWWATNSPRKGNLNGMPLIKELSSIYKRLAEDGYRVIKLDPDTMIVNFEMLRECLLWGNFDFISAETVNSFFSGYFYSISPEVMLKLDALIQSLPDNATTENLPEDAVICSMTHMLVPRECTVIFRQNGNIQQSGAMDLTRLIDNEEEKTTEIEEEYLEILKKYVIVMTLGNPGRSLLDIKVAQEACNRQLHSIVSPQHQKN